MLLAGITFSCLFLNVQTQNVFGQYPYYPHFRDPSSIYFPETVNALPLSLETQNTQISNDVLKQVFGEAPRKSNAVNFENVNEMSITTSPQRLQQSFEKRQEPSHNLQTDNNGPPVIAKPVRNGNQYNGLLYSVTNFGINLLKKINAFQSGNVVVSPYSITSLLALLQQGAIRDTQQEISRALQMSPADSAAAYFEICADYKKRNTRNILRTASNVFIGDTFVLNTTFKNIAQRNFDSDITPLSYEKPTEAARQINSWVASRTNNKIERLISPDALHGNTQVVLVNAIYFKGLWEVPFKPELTKPGQFQLGNGAIKTIPFMKTRRLIKTGIDPTTNAQVVILPFERNQYSLMVVLPSQEEGNTRTLASLTDARLLSYLSFSLVDTVLEIPKFTVRSDMDLTLLLRDMGITKAFSPYAELNGLGAYRAFSPQISSAIHSAVLSIDEQGGSAAAATAFTALALSYNEPTVVSFIVDRPFTVVLWDTATSLPLFMAKIEDPQQ